MESAFYQATKKRKRSVAPLNRRIAVFKRDNYTCQICGVNLLNTTARVLDHFYPFSKGGNNSRKNLWVLCVPCDKWKANKIYASKEECKEARLRFLKQKCPSYPHAKPRPTGQNKHGNVVYKQFYAWQIEVKNKISGNHTHPHHDCFHMPKYLKCLIGIGKENFCETGKIYDTQDGGYSEISFARAILHYPERFVGVSETEYLKQAHDSRKSD